MSFNKNSEQDSLHLRKRKSSFKSINEHFEDDLNNDHRYKNNKNKEESKNSMKIQQQQMSSF